LLNVTNASRNSVYQYNTVDDIFVGVFVPAGAGGLRAHIGLAFGPDRNLYVASFPNNAILRFDGSTGTFIDVFASVAGLDLDTPTDLVFGPDGNLYVLARSSTMPHSAVVRFDGATGVFIDVFIGVGSGGLGVTNTGMLFVDARCSRYGDNGFTNRCFPAGKGGRRK
jgi:DNA-binding beta-propeller fold protein YncE